MFKGALYIPPAVEWDPSKGLTEEDLEKLKSYKPRLQEHYLMKYEVEMFSARHLRWLCKNCIVIIPAGRTDILDALQQKIQLD